MDTPETTTALDKIAAALAKAQGVLKNPTFDKAAEINKGRKYRYASLAAILDVARPACAANGIAIVQAVQGERLVTRLVHESGQFVEAWYALPSSGTHHERGSAITYGCRYTLAPMLGIVGDDDDDGHAAVEADHHDELLGQVIELMGASLLGNKPVMDYCRANGLGDGKSPGDLSDASLRALAKNWKVVEGIIKGAAKPATVPPAKVEAAPAPPPPSTVEAELAPAATPDPAWPKHPKLAAMLRESGKPPAALERFIAAKKHIPACTCDEIPASYAEKLVQNWAKVLPEL